MTIKTRKQEDPGVKKEEQQLIEKIIEKHPRAFQGVGLLKGK